MIFEIGKKYCDKFYGGNVKKAVAEKDGILWTPQRISVAFSGGHGTEKDLKEYMKNNKMYAYFVLI